MTLRPESTVTVLVPVYNEGEMIAAVTQRIVAGLAPLSLTWSILILDDGSDDGLDKREASLRSMPGVDLRRFPKNRGKGAVLNDTFQDMRSTFTVVVDGDGEYAPEEIPRVLQPLLNGESDWVFGSRYGKGAERPRQYRAAYAVNRFVNIAFRLYGGFRFQDVLTGFYAFRSALVNGISLGEPRFAYTPELIWKVMERKPRWTEVPVSYAFRTYAQGKKIRWWETFTILAAIAKYGKHRR